MKLKGHYKITPDLDKYIRESAENLPPVAKADKDGKPIYRPAIVRGDHPQLKDTPLRKGQVLNPDATYRINQLVYENHIDNLIAGVKVNGPGFVKEYVDALAVMQKQAQAQLKVSLFTKIKNYIKSCLKKKN